MITCSRLTSLELSKSEPLALPVVFPREFCEGEAELEGFFKNTIKDENICGFNVTVPYKEKVIKHLDNLELVAIIL